MKAIMYHYVEPDQPDFPYMKSLHIDDFRKQLDYFEKKFGFVTHEEFNEMFITGRIPKGVVLTFDDGLISHYEFVFPELLKRKLWGIFFIPTQPIFENIILGVHKIHILLAKFNPKDVLDQLLPLIKDNMLVLKRLKEFKQLTYIDQENDNDTLKVKRILNYFLKDDYKNIIIDSLFKLFLFSNETELSERFYLNINQLQEMASNGMLIGSHTVSHPVLSKLTPKVQFDELNDSKNKLQSIIKQNVDAFCYPYGGFHTFTKTTIKILKDLGYKYSFNVEARDIIHSDIKKNPYSLPRYDCNFFKYGQVRSYKFI